MDDREKNAVNRVYALDAATKRPSILVSTSTRGNKRRIGERKKNK